MGLALGVTEGEECRERKAVGVGDALPLTVPLELGEGEEDGVPLGVVEEVGVPLRVALGESTPVPVPELVGEEVGVGAGVPLRVFITLEGVTDALRPGDGGAVGERVTEAVALG